MKYITYLISITFIYSCSSFEKRKMNSINFNEEIPIMIKVNQAELDAFGLPVNIDNLEEMIYCLKNNSILRDSFSTDIRIVMERKDSLVNFRFDRTNISIEGKFFIPPFQEIIYVHAFSPETLRTTILKPMKVHNVIRHGKWIIKEEGIERIVEYPSVNIDYSLMNNLCK